MFSLGHIGVASSRALIWRGVALLGIFALLQLGWQALANTPLQRFVIHDATVRPAVAVANWLTPGVHATAVNSRMQAAGGNLNILNGCEGMEALFLLFAAFMVTPIVVVLVVCLYFYTWRGYSTRIPTLG